MAEKNVPGSGATSLGAALSVAFRSTWVGASNDGTMVVQVRTIEQSAYMSEP